jgi:hypothetical protein
MPGKGQKINTANYFADSIVIETYFLEQQALDIPILLRCSNHNKNISTRCRYLSDIYLSLS